MNLPNFRTFSHDMRDIISHFAWHVCSPFARLVQYAMDRLEAGQTFSGSHREQQRHLDSYLTKHVLRKCLVWLLEDRYRFCSVCFSFTTGSAQIWCRWWPGPPT